MENLSNVEVKAGQYKSTEMVDFTLYKPKTHSLPKRVMKEILPHLRPISENWDTYYAEQIICEVQKNAQEKVRLSIWQPKDTKYLSIWVFWEDVDHEWHPSKNGLKLSKEELDQALPQLEALLS